jgi:hypothetical protein
MLCAFNFAAFAAGLLEEKVKTAEGPLCCRSHSGDTKSDV